MTKSYKDLELSSEVASFAYPCRYISLCNEKKAIFYFCSPLNTGHELDSLRY